jgi:hypothetical protein
MNRSEINDALRACNDVEAISDIALLAAMRMHELVASDAMKRAEIVLHGTYIGTSERYTVRITRDN